MAGPFERLFPAVEDMGHAVHQRPLDVEDNGSKRHRIDPRSLPQCAGPPWVPGTEDTDVTFKTAWMARNGSRLPSTRAGCSCSAHRCCWDFSSAAFFRTRSSSYPPEQSSGTAWHSC